MLGCSLASNVLLAVGSLGSRKGKKTEGVSDVIGRRGFELLKPIRNQVINSNSDMQLAYLTMHGGSFVDMHDEQVRV